MKISWNWLRELVEIPASIGPNEVAERFGLSGIPVDGMHMLGQGLSGAIVAEVRGKRPHPKADKLTLVDVFDGQSVTQVVCGAPNVPNPGEPGSSPRVVWARPGATLPNGLVLSVREVRGVPSPGMLCAEDELGLSTDHEGIIILSNTDGLEIGSDFAAGAGLPDVIFDLDITPNRPDLLGHVGVARELCALFASEGARLKLPATDLSALTEPRTAGSLAAVELQDPGGCPRYLGHVITGVTVAPSPLFYRLRLARLGVRPRSNVVDATNLALLEWGHPLHAFDLASLAERKVVVRRARAGETLKTLDDQQRVLLPTDVVIADAAQPVAIAGVMGGQNSEVRGSTTEILLESAYFEPSAVRRTARRLKLHTEASHRFERGMDANVGLAAAAVRCAELILKLAGGKLAAGSLDAYPQTVARAQVTLRPQRTDAILGMHIPPTTQASLLTTLGIEVATGEGGVLVAQVPTSRPDLTREIDLIEEVGRLYGIDKLTPTLPALRMAPPPEQTPAVVLRRNAETARDLCAALGLDEVQLFSMAGPEKLRVVGGAQAVAPLLLDNPLREELSVLRTQLLPGLLEALHNNLTHGLTDIRLFEVGEVFFPSATQGALPDERTRVAGVLTGHREHFLKPGTTDSLDLHDLRGLVEELLAGLGYELLWASPTGEASSAATARQVLIRTALPTETAWLHPGLAAVIVAAADGRIVGNFGELHPDLRKKLGIEPAAFSFELDIPGVAKSPQLFVAPSRFPAVTRDLSFFIDAGTPAGQVIATLFAAQEPLLSGVQILEDYRVAGHVPVGHKGLLFNLTYRSSERTLIDEEVHKAHERVVTHLQASLSVQLR